MATIKQISDYIIFLCKAEGDTDLSVLKHQKLLYYIQAWYLAFNEKTLFDEEFQAWIHGPVNREIYDSYKDTKCLYSEMSLDDMFDKEIVEKLSPEIKLHVETILDSYAKFSAIQLEIMTHTEDPWIEARQGFASSQKCEKIISKQAIRKYYAARLA